VWVETQTEFGRRPDKAVRDKLGERSSKGCCRSDQLLSSPGTREVWVYRVYQGRIASGCPGKVWVTKCAAKPPGTTSEVVPVVISEVIPERLFRSSFVKE
jgi:hypothetical protein